MITMTPSSLFWLGKARRLTRGSDGAFLELNPYQKWDMPFE